MDRSSCRTAAAWRSSRWRLRRRSRVRRDRRLGVFSRRRCSRCCFITCGIVGEAHALAADRRSPGKVPEAAARGMTSLRCCTASSARRPASSSSSPGRSVRFRQAARAHPDGVVILDADNRIEWCNDTAEAHFDLDVETDVGQPVINLMRQPEFVDYVESGDYSHPVELRCTRGAGAVSVACRSFPTATRKSCCCRATSPGWRSSRRCGAISSPTCRTNCARRSRCCRDFSRRSGAEARPAAHRAITSV